MFGILPLSPAFGQDFPSKKEVEKDFNDNKDFRTSTGHSINKEQIKGLNMKRVDVMYQKFTKVTSIKVI